MNAIFTAVASLVFALTFTCGMPSSVQAQDRKALYPSMAPLGDWEGVDYSELVLNPSSGPVQDYTVFTYDDFQSGQKDPPYPGILPFFDPAPNHIVSIREDRYKLAEYFAPDRPFLQSQWEMYDRLKDPLETQNLTAEGFVRNNEQEKEFVRLRAKLAVVKATRLQPLS